MEQVSTIAKFREKFENQLADRSKKVDADVAMGLSMNGLREDVRAKLKIETPNSLSQLMKLAQQIEEKNWAVESIKTGSMHNAQGRFNERRMSGRTKLQTRSLALINIYELRAPNLHIHHSPLG